MKFGDKMLNSKRKILILIPELLISGLAIFVMIRRVSAPAPNKLVPVNGSVLDPDGKPLVNVCIQFLPFPFSDIKANPKILIPQTMTDSRGQDEAECLLGTGIPARRYRVTINDSFGKNPSKVPARYQESATTPIEITIHRNGEANLVFRLE